MSAPVVPAQHDRRAAQGEGGIVSAACWTGVSKERIIRCRTRGRTRQAITWQSQSPAASTLLPLLFTPFKVAAGATDDHARRHLVLLPERPQLALVLVQEPIGGRPKRVREPRRHGDAGEIGRRPELDLGGRHMDSQVYAAAPSLRRRAARQRGPCACGSAPHRSRTKDRCQPPPAAGSTSRPAANASPGRPLALQLPCVRFSDSMGNHDSNIVDAGSVD